MLFCLKCCLCCNFNENSPWYLDSHVPFLGVANERICEKWHYWCHIVRFVRLNGVHRAIVNNDLYDWYVNGLEGCICIFSLYRFIALSLYHYSAYFDYQKTGLPMEHCILNQDSISIRCNLRFISNMLKLFETSSISGIRNSHRYLFTEKVFLKTTETTPRSTRNDALTTQPLEKKSGVVQ